VQGNSFQITDYVPSGLRLVGDATEWGYGFGDYEESDEIERKGYPFLVDGQRVVFDWYRSEKQPPFYYYARVVSKGTYKAESAEIQSSDISGSVNYSPQYSIVVQ
jgi:hypothetical protein